MAVGLLLVGTGVARKKREEKREEKRTQLVLRNRAPLRNGQETSCVLFS
jgi:hypothetical protein